MDGDWEDIAKETSANPDIDIAPDQLVYIIYTSGSTGRPKGVMIEHRNTYAFIAWCQEEFSADCFNIVYTSTSICFDLSVFELFYPLSTGKAIRVLENGLAISNYLSHDVQVLINTVPSVIEHLINERADLGNVTVINMAGEPIPARVVEGLDTENISVRNLYGPTEDTTYSTSYLLEKGKPVTIGKPIANTQIHILSKDRELVSIGVAGEICIGGAGVARGYLNKKELTEEKFIKDPFSVEQGSKLYRTGDLGRWLPDGNIEYLGRMDDQVKIRGFRIELGEIENVLNQSALVKQGVVLAKADKQGTKRLVGYVVPEKTFSKPEIQNYLNTKLPEYMVPAIWVELEQIPLTPNGKIDKRALPDPEMTDRTVEYTAPQTETEQALADIWQELLGIERPGIYHNFFELGGHSLSAMRAVSAIRRELQAEIGIKDFFVYPTISGLANWLSAKQKGSAQPAILKGDRPEQIPLSYSQERLWFLDKLEGSVQYHLPAIIRLRGAVNHKLLEKAFRTVIGRHEVLRTVIPEDSDGKGYQQVLHETGWMITLEDQTAKSTEALDQYIEAIINTPFDLSADYMLRANLIKTGKENHVLLITMHHIASDGWSTSILVKEIVEIYKAFSDGREVRLPELVIQYADYAIWQRNYLRGEILNNKINYWKQKLDGTTPLELPLDYHRPAVRSPYGANESIRIEKELSERLLAMSYEQGATLYMTLLAAFKVLLHRYSGQEDICVGTPVAGRGQQEIEGLVGFFVNTLALRSDVSADMTFISLLQEVKETTLEAYSHQDVPFEKVVDAVVKERDMSRSPLFQVMFALQNTPEVPELKLGDMMLQLEEGKQDISKYDLTFTLAETPEGLLGSAEYSTDRYRGETITRMINHYINLLRSITATPEEKVSRLGMLSEAEEQTLLTEFNLTRIAYPKDKTIVELFREQVIKNPGTAAVIYENEELSYSELDKRSNQLSNYLQQRGIKAETMVPICIERSMEMMVGILGIMKAGGAYVPIDPAYPQDRISYMLEDTGAVLVVSSSSSREKLQESNIKVIALDSDWHEIEKESDKDPHTAISSDQLAYVIYTSGSTGRPKGVMVEHGNLVSICNAWREAYNLSSFEIRVLQLASMSFDVFAGDMCRTLPVGGTLIICPEKARYDLDELYKLIEKHKINVFETTPGLIVPLIKHIEERELTLDFMKVLVMGSDTLDIQSYQHLRHLYASKFRIINGYGTTETTIDSIYFEGEVKNYAESKVMPIGKPFLNTKVYILNSGGQKQPVGVAGELCIGGAGVSRGYLNQPELTVQKFAPDPFAKEQGARLYRTGDLARWLPDGNVEYLGRIDDQVKIRGYRVELGEIESVLNQSPGVKQSVVLAREDDRGTKRLVGYVATEGTFDKQEVQNYLSTKLPEYMVPALWVELESIPLTSNGKIDKKALPEPDMSAQTKTYIAPGNEIEVAIAAVWQELLGADRVGIHDNFFELGGDSILTIQVVSRLRRLGYTVQPKDLFTYQTVAGLSAAIAKGIASAASGEQGTLKGTFGLIPIQQSYLEKEPAELSHFNQSVLLKIDKRVTAAVLQTALDSLRERHDALRLRFKKQDGLWEQEYALDHLELTVDALEEESNDTIARQINTIADRYQRSLSITEGQLMRMVLIETPERETDNRLFVVIHHLAVDGVSWRVLLEDMEQLLTGLIDDKQVSLGTKSSSYRQWQAALIKYSGSKSLQAQRDYWERIVSSYKPLPEDKKYTGEVLIKDLQPLQLKLSKEQTRQLLQEVPRVYHTEINDLLIAALAAALSNWSGGSDVVIGLEGHGREAINGEIDTSGTVGWFTSSYPVLLRGETDAGRLIKGVKEELRRIPDKGLGYGVLKYISRAEALQGRDSWDLEFNYLGQLDTATSSGEWFSISTEQRGSETSGEQLSSTRVSINSHIFDRELVFNWSYSKVHYTPETISKVAADYIDQLQRLITHCIERGKTAEVYTPSDYGLGAEVSYQELDDFLEEQYNDKQIKDYVERLYRLSGLQQGMLFYSLYEESSGSYIDQLNCNLYNVNLPALFESWSEVIKRHSILRSAFYYNSFSIPIQCVFRDVKLPIIELDYRGMDETTQVAAFKEYERADRSKGFDFKAPPLMRVTLIRLDDTRYKMLWTSHHILVDGWSLPVLVGDLLTIYELLVSGDKVPTFEEDCYEEYIRYLEKNSGEAEERYWRSYLDGIDQGTLLPFVKADADRTKGIGRFESLSITLNGTKIDQIQNYAKSHHLTINTLMQGVWALLLHRYTGSDEIIYGTVVSGRPDELSDVEHRVGMYINTLPFKAAFSNEQEIVSWLQSLQSEQASSRQYQYTALQDIQGWVGIKGDLFDNILVFENFPVSKLIASREWLLQVTDVQISEQTNYPLTVTIGIGEELSIDFSYNTDLLNEAYVAAIRDQFEHALLQLTDGSASGLNDIKLLTASQQEQLSNEFNSAETAFPQNKNIIDLFEEQAAGNPTAVAVIFEGQELSYDDLNKRSNQVAYLLRHAGVNAETLVPICIERGLEMIVGILGILKAGAAYVPIDPTYPKDRINYMLEDTAAEIIVCNSRSRENLLTSSARVIELNGDWGQIEKESDDNPNININPGQLAYVIYTSGSTGKPKGVMVEHGNLVSICYAWKEAYNLSSFEVRLLQSASMSFDVFSGDICRTLLVGGTLIICPDEVKYDLDKLYNFILKHKINIFESTPGLILPLIKHTEDQQLSLDFMKVLVLGSDTLTTQSYKHLCDLYASKFRIINSYGTTETTIDSLYFEGDVNDYMENGTLPIGNPFSNTKVYILNKAGEQQPLGVPGELHIGGPGVSRGYLHRANLTSERFVENPYGPGRLYRTGDMTRWLPDGNVEFLGRMDDQVKIRGYRVELGEIENALDECEMVSQAVVLAKGDGNGNKHLVGYIVPQMSLDRQVLQNYLSSKLPEYMVPTIWIELEKLPLTPNGKTDRKALPDPELAELTAEYVAPRNLTEKRLADIWKELLGAERTGINDNFFELGGHSLLAMRMVSAIRKEFKLELAIRDVFAYPSIAVLSKHLEEQAAGFLLPAIVQEHRSAYIPLSFSQERLWFIDRLEGSLQYHLPEVLRLKGRLNPEVLEKTLREIINRHEVLRTVILEQEGKGYQKIITADGWALGNAGRIKEERKEDLHSLIGGLINKPFNLSADYMLRADLITLDHDNHVLVVTMHHIASDGWSTSILVNEVITLYVSYSDNIKPDLLPLKIQYADYAIWQRKYMQGEVLESRLNYWKAKLKDVAPLQLPSDYSPQERSTQGGICNFRIDTDLLANLLKLSHQQGATLFMTLLASFKVLLYRYSAQEDICVGTPVAGRNQHELERLIGFFLNTLALRSRVTGEMSFSELLHELKETALEAFKHQEVPFEKVVDAVVKQRDMNRSPLFQVMFIFQNAPEVPKLQLKDLSLSVEDMEQTTTMFDIVLTISETDDGLQGAMEYSTDFYREETIARMVDHYKNLLGSIAVAPAEKVSLLGMLTETEEQTLLENFNETAAAYPEDKSVTDLFEEQVARRPETVATVFDGVEISYQELNKKSNQVARYLQKYGVKAETLVPICIERGLEMLIGILAIMKAGGVYVPIDPDFPTDRISYMLEDSGAELALTSKGSREKLGSGGIKLITLDEDWTQIEKEENNNLETRVSPEQLAYVIYTSGSTGKPKGVMIRHRSVVNLLTSITKEVVFTQSSKFLSVTTYSFDICYLELYVPLINGGELVIASRETASDGFRLVESLSAYRPTHMQATPSTWQMLAEADWRNEEQVKMLVGGEAVKEGIKDYLTGIGEVWNVYGPTETTIWSAIKKLSGVEKVNIGKPLSNTQIYIISGEKELNPIGVNGEICIGGAGLARGYWNRPDLTAEKFIVDPFAKEPGARLYRTGDLGRWLPDGNIECLGRIDDQVKVKGYRIELGEIESVLNQAEQVKLGVVLVKADTNGNNRLVGYVVPKDKFDKQEIQGYLGTKLPEYMIPAIWVEMEQIPLTPNGKINRKSLPDPEVMAIATEYIAPRNQIEQALADIWQELLGVERVGIFDNFFELGGDSILTIQVVSRMRRQGHIIQPKDIFKYQVVADLSEAIEKGAESFIAAEQGILSGSFGLIPIQSRYFETELLIAPRLNQQVLLKINKNIGAEMLQIALDRLIERHDALRLRFKKEGGVWEQEYGTNLPELSVEDLPELHKAVLPDQIRMIAQECRRSLSITEGRLMRMVMIRTPEEEEANRLLLVMHHLLTDGISWQILQEDMEQVLDELMNHKPLYWGEKGSSYRQWQASLVKYSKSQKLSGQKAYWEGIACAYDPFPKDQEYSEAILGKDIQDYEVKLGEEYTQFLLQDVLGVYHTEINDLLLGALCLALCKWSGKSQVVIGLEGHGREVIDQEIDNSGTIGWFTNSYPVLLKKNTTADAGQLIKGIKEDLRRVPDKGLGYGVLKYINKLEELQGDDPWDLDFNYLGQLQTTVSSGRWLSVSTEDKESEINEEQLSVSKLSVNSYIFEGNLILNWSYSIHHYHRETISSVADEYVAQLMYLIAHCIEQGKSKVIHTPADYGLGAEISYEELDRFLEEPYTDDDIMSF
ncbi:MAG TPA: amino acid adenylation domain-containing protein [Mucilaginibacter sp.]